MGCNCECSSKLPAFKNTCDDNYNISQHKSVFVKKSDLIIKDGAIRLKRKYGKYKREVYLTEEELINNL